MKQHVIKTTRNFTKENGQIICNKGAQAQEVLELLQAHNYEATIVPTKNSRIAYKYKKKEIMEEK